MPPLASARVRSRAPERPVRAAAPGRRPVGVVAVLAALSLGGCTGGSSEAAQDGGAPPGTATALGPVVAFPSPGARTASPQTTITLRGVSAEDVGEVSVTGSVSGEHATSVLEHSDGAGVSLVPDEPFEPGEEVAVDTGLDLLGAGGGTTSFTVATPAEGANPTPAELRPLEPGDQVHRFVTEPDLHPPVVKVSGAGATGSGGDVSANGGALIAIGMDENPVQLGPLLVDERGEPVFFRSTDTSAVFDVEVGSYRGQDVLTWWEGFKSNGFGAGEAVLVDTAYAEIARVPAGNGYGMDLHEVELTDAGTLLVLVYEPVRWDASAVGGTGDDVVLDGIVQEIDVETGAVLFEWHGLDALRLTESYRPFEPDGRPWDWLHLNSVDVDTDGNLLVSVRDTCSIVKLDRRSGEVLWRLGGKRSDYEMGEGAQFLRQHDVRRADDGTLTLFDNGQDCQGREVDGEFSRGLVLAVDDEAMTASVAAEYPHPDRIYGGTRGSFQGLPDGGALVGWGSGGAWTHFSADGEVVSDASFADTISYRARWTPRWSGRPAQPPAAALVWAADGSLEAVASWNGATDVARWRVTDAADSSVVLAAADRAGFETRLPLEASGGGAVVVEALDDGGEVLGTSAPVTLG